MTGFLIAVLIFMSVSWIALLFYTISIRRKLQ
jgi:hypothetical protein